MGNQDFHNKKFADSTKVKLELFRLYIREWLPVFLCTPHVERLVIYDYFCGSGCDNCNTPGSPIILLDELKRAFRTLINIPGFNPSRPIHIFFNDKDSQKISELKSRIPSALPSNVKITISSDSFRDKYQESKAYLKCNKTACFLLIDQFGLKHFTTEVFKEVASAPMTDWITFCSSSQARRFAQSECFSHIPSAVFSDHTNAHRDLAQAYRAELPVNKKYFTVPFSLKSGSNIYGLLFGSAHELGAEKFIRGCWKVDKVTGESNYYQQTRSVASLLDYTNYESPRIQTFKRELEYEILNEKLRTNEDVYHFCLQNGFLNKHAKSVIDNLKKNKKLAKGRVLLSYESICKKKRIEALRLLK